MPVSLVGDNSHSIIKQLLPVLFSLLSCAAASAQSDQTNKTGNVDQQQRIRVVYQLTDVTVRDGNGGFVKGLGKDDFTLLINDSPVEIKFVEEFSPADDAAVKRYVEESAAALEVESEPPIPPSPPRTVVLAFDQFNMGPKATAAAKRSAIEVVGKALLPYDYVTVLQYNGFFVTLSKPTTNREKTLAAIKKVGEPTRNPFYYPNTLELFPPNYKDLAETERKTYEMVFTKNFNLQKYLISLKVLASALKSLPGRKVCILFSEGPNTYYPFNISVSSGGRRYYASWSNRFEVRENLFNPQIQAGNYLIDIKNLKDANPKAVLEEVSQYFNSANTSLFTARRGAMEPDWYTLTYTDLKQGISDAVFKSTLLETRLNRMKEERTGSLEGLSEPTNGGYYGPEAGDEELIAAVKRELGSYYLIGFEPPFIDPGVFHHIKVATKERRYKVTHRRGFFQKKKYGDMTREEKAAHMEEGFLSPGILNELGLRAEGYEIPLNERREALLAFEIDAAELERDADGRSELEMVVNLVDREGQLLYREHMIFRITLAGEESSIWRSVTVPLTNEWCALYLGLRDNADGRRSTWNKVFQAVESQIGLPVMGGMIVCSSDAGIRLANGNAEIVDDGVELEKTASSPAVGINSRPNPTGEVKQGGSVPVICTVGALPSGFDPQAAALNVQFALDPQSDDAYLLVPSDLRIQYLSKSGALVITATVPIGLAQRPSGDLFIAVSGLPGEATLLSSFPYRIESFSKAKAGEFLSDGRLVKLGRAEGKR